MEKTYKQKGKNNKYPTTIQVWKLGDSVPEWLSNIAKVGAINENTGELSLFTRDTNTGGFELLDSGGTISLVKTKSRKDYVCKPLESRGPVFSLTPLQLKMLYEEY